MSVSQVINIFIKKRDSSFLTRREDSDHHKGAENHSERAYIQFLLKETGSLFACSPCFLNVSKMGLHAVLSRFPSSLFKMFKREISKDSRTNLYCQESER